MPSSYKSQALLAVITAAALAPFLDKAFYVDDPLFIWMAQQIAQHPLDPYGFDLNWSSFTQPMSLVMQNPPLCSYYIAAIGSIFGWSEISLHTAFLFWAIMSILGTFALAQRFCALEGRARVYPPRRASPSSHELRPPDKRTNATPFQTALLTLFTPIFLCLCDHRHVRRDDAGALDLGARILAGGPGSATMVVFVGFSGTDFRCCPNEILRTRTSAAARRLYSGPGSPFRDLPSIPPHPTGGDLEL